MGFRVAQRAAKRLRIAVSGQSGAGKTKGALRLAYGLTGNWGKIGVIDSEQGSASLYANMGPFLVQVITAPFEPRKYVQAIHEAVQAGIECLIIDSITHEWVHCREWADKLQQGGKNKFTVWGQITPQHDAFVQAQLQAPLHLIATMRSKTDWVLEDDGKGKTRPKKVGLKDDQREGLEYEFDVAFKLTREHLAECDKDRTELFSERMPFELTEAVGQELREWANAGIPVDEQIFDKTNPADKIWARAEFDRRCPTMELPMRVSIATALDGRPKGKLGELIEHAQAAAMTAP